MSDDNELERRLMAVKHPNGPEDNVIEGYGFTWDQLKEFSEKKEWPLASKLAACCIDLGLVAEEAVERAEFYKLQNKKLDKCHECGNPEFGYSSHDPSLRGSHAFVRSPS